jgi:beta-lactamase class A
MNIRVLRGVEDEKAFQAGKNNTVTAFDLMILFESIARGKAVNQQSSKAMIDILLQQRFNEQIPALLPPGVQIAHKTGSITGVQHDSGIVFLPDGRKYVVILLSKDLPNAKKGIGILANISKMIYEYEVQ